MQISYLMYFNDFFTKQIPFNEFQNKTNNLLPKRFLSYLCRSYVADLKVATKYHTLKQTVLIIIMHSSFPNISEESNYHTVWRFREDSTKEVLSDDLQIHIIELPKYKKQKERTRIEEPWIEFLLDPFGKGVEKYMRSKKEIEEAVKQLRMLNADDEVRELAEAQERAELDRNTELYIAKEDGRAEGKKEAQKEEELRQKKKSKLKKKIKEKIKEKCSNLKKRIKKLLPPTASFSRSLWLTLRTLQAKRNAARQRSKCSRLASAS